MSTSDWRQASGNLRALAQIKKDGSQEHELLLETAFMIEEYGRFIDDINRKSHVLTERWG